MTDASRTTNGEALALVPARSAPGPLGAALHALARVLMFWRRPHAAPRPAAGGGGAHLVPTGDGGHHHHHRPLGKTWQFRLLHVAGLVVTVPAVAATRLRPAHWHEHHDESVFVEANRAVLTALGFAFMS